MTVAGLFEYLKCIGAYGAQRASSYRISLNPHNRMVSVNVLQRRKPRLWVGGDDSTLITVSTALAPARGAGDQRASLPHTRLLLGQGYSTNPQAHLVPSCLRALVWSFSC